MGEKSEVMNKVDTAVEPNIQVLMGASVWKRLVDATQESGRKTCTGGHKSDTDLLAQFHTPLTESGQDSSGVGSKVWSREDEYQVIGIN